MLIGEEGSNDLPDDPGLLLIPKYVEKVYNSDPVTLDVPEIWGNSETGENAHCFDRLVAASIMRCSCAVSD